MCCCKVLTTSLIVLIPALSTMLSRHLISSCLFSICSLACPRLEPTYECLSIWIIGPKNEWSRGRQEMSTIDNHQICGSWGHVDHTNKSGYPWCNPFHTLLAAIIRSSENKLLWGQHYWHWPISLHDHDDWHFQSITWSIKTHCFAYCNHHRRWSFWRYI